MRQVVLDTETTGLEVERGHRILEIGAVEIIDRKDTGNHFHEYINPQRAIDSGALEVHGLTEEFLADKPVFHEISEKFLDFIGGAELVIHNAPFDISFLNKELSRCEESNLGKWNKPGGALILEDICGVLDSLAIARDLHPGQKNSLDALCRRYEVDNSGRTLHGALLDAEILAEVFLLMTGGQTQLFEIIETSSEQRKSDVKDLGVAMDVNALRKSEITEAEWQAHQKLLEVIEAASGETLLWPDINS
jgi:DNA polymerase-3 subunit epsilon